eukprot:2655222-Prymnesium_polylepis.2
MHCDPMPLHCTRPPPVVRYNPFLDRLSLDAVENIPMYVEQTVTFVIAVTSQLFVSYWCGVELCKAVEFHATGKLNILLVPIQGERWTDPETQAELEFPSPACVLANFGTWFPELPERTQRLIRELYGGGEYTSSRLVKHTLMHYKSFERLLIARCHISIKSHRQLEELVADGSSTTREVAHALLPL